MRSITPLILSLVALGAAAPPKRPVPLPEMPYADQESSRPEPGQGLHDRWNPKLPDLERFPDRDCCERQVAFLELLAWNVDNNLAWAEWIGDREEAARLEKWKEDVRGVLHAWHLLKWIRMPYSGSDEDRERLKQLRKLLGERAYWEGQMPLPDPRYFQGYD